jgi:hypothetical protein
MVLEEIFLLRQLLRRSCNLDWLLRKILTLRWLSRELFTLGWRQREIHTLIFDLDWVTVVREFVTMCQFLRGISLLQLPSKIRRHTKLWSVA